MKNQNLELCERNLKRKKKDVEIIKCATKFIAIYYISDLFVLANDSKNNVI